MSRPGSDRVWKQVAPRTSRIFRATVAVPGNVLGSKNVLVLWGFSGDFINPNWGFNMRFCQFIVENGRSKNSGFKSPRFSEGKPSDSLVPTPSEDLDGADYSRA